MAWQVHCHACALTLDFEDPVGRSARCPKCGSDLRCCLNCRFHDVSAYNDCSETSAERVLEKDRANFCDFFSPGASAAHARLQKDAAQEASDGAAGDKLSELEKLFRKN